MKLLITTNIFPPERHPSAIIAKELTEYATDHGWQVSVVTGFPNHPFGKLFTGYKRRLIQVHDQNGYRLVRAWHLISGSSKLISRALVMVSQTGAYLIGALACSRPDVVINGPPPIIGPLISGLIARAYGAKLVNVIYDIYPDAAVNLGILKNPTIIAAARKVERLTYFLSDQITVLSEGFRQTLILGKKVDPEKVSVIPVWLDGSEVFPQDRDNNWRREIGIPLDKFIVLYAGTIGLVSGAEVVAKAARLLVSNLEILFLLVGTGQAKNRVERMAQEAGLKNIQFLPFQDRERLSEVQATADLSLVTLAPGSGKSSVPSKILGYMAAARPIIASVDSDCDTAKIIREAGCGTVVPPNDANALAEGITYYFKRSRERHIAGLSGRRYFLENFEKRKVLRNYLKLLSDLAMRMRI